MPRSRRLWPVVQRPAARLVVRFTFAMSITPEQIAGIAISLLAGSEMLSLIPGIRANGWVQLILGILKGIASTRR